MRHNLNLTICLAVAALLLPLPMAAETSPKVHPVSIGMVNSPKGLGISMDIGPSEFHSIAVTADLTEIISGKSSVPGFKLTYHYNMPFFTGKTDSGYRYSLYAGPGIAQGYVRGVDNRLGYMAGVSGAVGGRIGLQKRITIAIEFQGELALIFKNRHNSCMSLYTAGIRHCYYPFIRIQYSL